MMNRIALRTRWLSLTWFMMMVPMMVDSNAQGVQQGAGESWPQRFQLNGPEPVSFGFAVTVPGVIHIDVQAQGAPIQVALIGPTPQRQTGTGDIALSYSVTGADIQRSALWHVRITLLQPPPRAGQPLAGGSISVQHPPADAGLVQQNINALLAQHNQAVQQLQAQMATDLQTKLRARQAELTRRQDSVRAAAEARLPPAVLQTRVTTRSLPMPQPLKAAIQPAVPVRVPLPTPPTPPRQAPPPPVITGMSDTQALPRQLVTISGSGFGPQVGAVEFLINPGWKSYGAVQAWSDTLIAVYVPDAAGVVSFPGGTVTTLRAADSKRSNAFLFGFVAELESRYVTHLDASRLGDFVVQSPGALEGPSFVGHGPDHTSNLILGLFYGAKGDDVFFSTTRLANPWQVDWVQVYTEDTGFTGSAGAWDAGDRVGTNMPFVTAHWYYDACTYLLYGFQEQITGPRGTADGILVTTPPAPIGVIPASQ